MKIMFQKFYAVLMVAAIMFCALPFTVSAKVVTGGSEDSAIWSLNTDTGELTFDGYAAGWDESLEPYRENIKSIVFSEGIMGAYEGAFKNCPNLTSVVLSDDMEWLSDGLFRNCAKLVEVKFGDGLKSIGDAFEGCVSLKKITVSENNPYFSSDKDGVLYNKDKTELVKYPKGKTETSYTIPQSVKTIGYCAFADCVNLKKIIISNNVSKIMGSAFHGCSNLTDITIPQSVNTIEYSAFSGCSSLTNIVFPEGITVVDQGMFSGCETLKSVYIPAGVTSVGIWAFMDCEHFTDVYYGGSEEQWSQVSIVEEYNEKLLNATIHFNYTPPQSEVAPPQNYNDINVQETTLQNDKDTEEIKTVEDRDNKSESSYILSTLIVVLLCVVIVMLAVVMILLVKKKKTVK